MRTIIDLTKLKGKVYIFLKDKTIEEKFLLDAENEGFHFDDGKLPTSSMGNDIYRLNSDWTICHTGMATHMAYRSKGEISIGECHFIDYERYVLDLEGYDDMRQGKCS